MKKEIVKQSGTIQIKSDGVLSPADESHHEGSVIEWWFVQGYYDGERTGRRSFMASVFRHRANSNERELPYGFSLILSVLDHATGTQQALSRIDPATVEIFLQAARELRHVNLDKRLIGAYCAEIKDYGPPAPILTEKAPVNLTSRPFGLTWKDFSISQSPCEFALSFTEPDDNRRCWFKLFPVRPRIYIEGIGEPATSSLPYATYPSLKLEGKAGGERVKGEGWLDHQWGSSGAWAVTNTKRKKVVGWDWFGINLDDGSELLLIEHRDMKTRRSISKCSIVRRREHGPIVVRDFTTQPLGYWHSPATQITYPVAWRITIPGLGADLVFRPLSEDQELHIFGIARSLWEGAGTVTGTIGKRTVTGRARLELHGYGYIFNSKDYFKSFSRQVDESVKSFFPVNITDDGLRRFIGPPQWKHEPAAYNETIARPIWDLMSRRGKQWRAIFDLLLLEALGVPYRRYLDLASVISELCHTGSLIIDDIEDNSRIRRGDTCVHLRHGLDVAINAANTIYFLPFLLLADHPGLNDAQRVESYKIVFRAFVRAHFGQALDIHWSKSMSRKHLAQLRDTAFGDKILQMYADKTAAFIEAAAESACIVAGVDSATRAACLHFYRILGVAFQITDDVLNFSDSPGWGKASGEDLREGKTTYVIYRALKALEPPDRKRLEKILCTKRLRRDPAALQAGVELIRKSGVLEVTRKESKDMVDEAWSKLSRYLKPSEPKVMLRLLYSTLIEIVYES